MPNIVPWVQQPGEGGKPFRAFALYRDMGPDGRSLDAVALRLRGDPSSSCRPSGRRLRSQRIQIWSREWRWVERAAAWDRHVDEQVQQALIDEVIKMAKRHAIQARAIQEKAVRRLVELDPAELRPGDVLRWLVAGCRLESQGMEALLRMAAPAVASSNQAGFPESISVVIARSETSDGGGGAGSTNDIVRCCGGGWRDEASDSPFSHSLG